MKLFVKKRPFAHTVNRIDSLSTPAPVNKFPQKKMSSTPKKVLLVVTSASELGGTPTGIWLAELAEPWYAFKAAGYEITLASTAGGACSIGKHMLNVFRILILGF